MPEKKTTRPVRKAKSPSTQAGEYVREEVEHVREGKHGARSAKQVITIGLSKARRAGLKPPPPLGKKAPHATGRKPNPTRSRAAHQALEGEGTAAAVAAEWRKFRRVLDMCLILPASRNRDIRTRLLRNSAYTGRVRRETTLG